MSEERKGITKVDIEGIIKNKNPKLHRRLPRFVLNYIKRATHEKEMNEFFAANGHKFDREFATAVIDNFNITRIVEGEENIREKGGVIFASNHPQGAIDAMLLIETIGKKRGDMKFIVNDILMNITNLNGIFVGVNKHGKTSNETFKEMDALYGTDQAIIIFPAGLVSRKQKGKIVDLEWKKSFIAKAKKYQRDVIPVYIEINNTRWFYNLGRFRKFLGIKANIEMFYLIDEMYKQKDKTIKIVFGKPLSYTMFDKSHTDLEWAQIVKQKVYELGEKK